MAGGVAGRPRLLLLLCLLLSSGVPVLVHGNCPRPTPSAEMVMTSETQIKNEFPDGSTAVFQCGSGYQKAGGMPGISCVGGEWTDVTLICQKKSCGSPGEVLNGRFDTSDGTEFGARVRAICNEGYEIVGQSYRQCLDQGWAGRIPTCEAVTCDEPSEISNGRIVSKPDREYPQYQDIIEYECSKGYTLVGKKNIMCGARGKYEPQVPECKDITCEIPSVLNGRRVSTALPPYRVDNFITFECREGYKMDGQAQITCTVDGWSPPQPTCKLVTPTFNSTTASPETDPEGKGDNENSTGSYLWLIIGGPVAFLLTVGGVAFAVMKTYRKKGSTVYSQTATTP